MRKIRHTRESGLVLYLLHKNRYGFMEKEDIEEESDLVQWAFIETINDLLEAKFIRRFTNMYDASQTYFQITEKGEKLLYKSAKSAFVKVNKQK